MIEFLIAMGILAFLAILTEGYWPSPEERERWKKDKEK